MENVIRFLLKVEISWLFYTRIENCYYEFGKRCRTFENRYFAYRPPLKLCCVVILMDFEVICLRTVT